MSAHTIWTKPALTGLNLATCTEQGMIFGISWWSDVLFRFTGNRLNAHTGKGKIPDATAIMERRGN